MTRPLLYFYSHSVSGHDEQLPKTENGRAHAYSRRDARRSGAGRRHVSRTRRCETDCVQWLAGVAAASHQLHSPLRLCRHLSFLRHLRVLHPSLLGQSTRGGHRGTQDQLLPFLETTRPAIVPTLLRRARNLSLLPRIQNSCSRHELLLVGCSASCVHAAQHRPANDLHDQRRVLDTRDRRTVISRLLPAALPAHSLRLGQDVADNLRGARRLGDHGPRVERDDERSHSRDRSSRDELVYLGVGRAKRRGRVRTDKTSALVLQDFNVRPRARLRNGSGAAFTPRRSKRLDTRYWLAGNAPGLGRWVLHPCKLRGRGRAALAGKIHDCAANDPVARVSRAHVILALFDAFVRADALVPLWFHKTAHSHGLVTDHDAVIGRVCMDLLPRV